MLWGVHIYICVCVCVYVNEKTQVDMEGDIYVATKEHVGKPEVTCGAFRENI